MKIEILDLKIDKMTMSEVLAKSEEFLVSGKQHYIVTLNPEMALVAKADEEFKKIVNKADLVVPDGVGLLWAATVLSKGKEDRSGIFEKTKLFAHGVVTAFSLVFYSKYSRQVLPERIHGIDLLLRLVNKYHNRKEIKFFLLGAQKGVASVAAKRLAKKFPGMNIVGTFSGDADKKGDKVALALINQAKPDILFVAYGAPKQEKWIARNLKKMPSVKMAVGVGGSYDMISGKIKRAPVRMRNANLEWLWRLIVQPVRIGRIYNATVKFPWLILAK